eukprot:COSAG05_NODE_2241_length_3352_cov_2.277283_3_plen_119_part_00
MSQSEGRVGVQNSTTRGGQVGVKQQYTDEVLAQLLEYTEKQVSGCLVFVPERRCHHRLSWCMRIARCSWGGGSGTVEWQYSGLGETLAPKERAGPRIARRPRAATDAVCRCYKYNKAP